MVWGPVIDKGHSGEDDGNVPVGAHSSQIFQFPFVHSHNEDFFNTINNQEGDEQQPDGNHVLNYYILKKKKLKPPPKTPIIDKVGLTAVPSVSRHLTSSFHFQLLSLSLGAQR